MNHRPTRRPPLVIVVVLLHLVLLFESIVSNVYWDFARIVSWVSHPIENLQLSLSLNLWADVITVASAVCVIGLWISKSWAWWLAVVMDSYFTAWGLIGLYAFFLLPLSESGRAFAAMGILDAAALFLLLLPQVRRHYVRSFTEEYPAWGRFIQSLSIAGVDKVMVRLVAAVTLLESLYLGIYLFALLRYAEPVWLFWFGLYVALGLLVGWRLLSPTLTARKLGLCWHAVFLGYIFLIKFTTHWRLRTGEEAATGGVIAILVVLYLAATILVKPLRAGMVEAK
jgi:hypothetical protein